MYLGHAQFNLNLYIFVILQMFIEFLFINWVIIYTL